MRFNVNKRKTVRSQRIICWVLQIKFRSSDLTVNVSTGWTISPAPWNLIQHTLTSFLLLKICNIKQWHSKNFLVFYFSKSVILSNEWQLPFATTQSTVFWQEGKKLFFVLWSMSRGYIIQNSIIVFGKYIKYVTYVHTHNTICFCYEFDVL